MDDQRFEHELRQALIRRAPREVPASLASGVHAIPVSATTNVSHRSSTRARSWIGGAATLVVTLVVGATVLALRPSAQPSSGAGAQAVATTTATSAAATAPVAATTAPVAGDTNPFDAAVQAMVEDGTINQHQADVLRQHVDAGRLDVQALVDSGTLTAAEGKAVLDRLGAIKRSLAPSDPGTAATDPRLKLGQQGAGPAGVPGSKVPSASAAAEMNAAKEAADAAVQALVVDGTINQHQADAVRQMIDAGSVDAQALVDNGTLTAAQMQVVIARLIAVKESFAAGTGLPAPAAAPASKDPSPTN